MANPKQQMTRNSARKLWQNRHQPTKVLDGKSPRPLTLPDLPAPVWRHLIRLLEMGLYGATVEEIAERLMCEQLKKMVDDRIIGNRALDR